ncbi:MAG: hypothetical protein UR34_C0018G0003 [candidate division WS6 bacterium GW2011_GWC1_33_20]|uniref:Neutral zinc metallopeptidase n=2 Tax=Candidatus Dojkabacteria TaxID=74243 RepID=A0A0G0DG55_9BACT|nr:MAG: hypothetical protein UR32_C0009G0016 [candidate division WS6 bacterium GW2011_GWE2_33_157]KKP43348.1 MAG: hypothetical protein UR34_C0018G0003 [candidate division WS6 bacterium GW2011_GWC1_33_20]KKP45601.1 MAG: hypothetical protein UR36_C0007G0016 [candidate division WS6 bacterium GW2011_GWF1_33_233]KKP53216.1 MAG: hypothetical protein UR45_C0031G0008 [candidate division WS6 bacterium GW2011_WS6_33_547]KKP54347.1 MAG: hypothetical protein UR47_C0020G0008 [candidate division WS6 bacteriu
MFYDPIYYLYLLPALLFAAIAQIWISTSYSKYSKIPSSTGETGESSAEIIMKGEDFPVDIEIKGKALSDYFDPKRNIVSLSTSSKNSSIGDIAVVAHEFGHVQQKFTSSFLFKVRTGLVPIINITSKVGYILIILGLILQLFQLSEIGLILFAGSTLFAFISIPIELDATKRGLALIKKYKLLGKDQISGAKSVLYSAAFTYVAALLSSLLNLLYYASLVKRKN